MPPFLRRSFEATALAVAIAEVAREYIRDRDARRIIVPAISRGIEQSNISDVWEHTRIEAMLPLFRHGAANLSLLADMSKQKELFDMFVDERPHLKYPHVANNDPLHDTLQAAFQALVYLRERADDAGARFGHEKGFLNLFEHTCAFTHLEWCSYAAGSEAARTYLPEMPALMFEILWKEVTRRAKEVAVAWMFGSSFEDAMQRDLAYFRSQMAKQRLPADEIEKEITAIAAQFDRLRTAQEPEQLLSSSNRGR
jgi:hypothetical protein